jgi:hypothetical protein
LFYDVLRAHTKFGQNTDILRWHKIALHLLYKRLHCFTLVKHVCLVISFGRTMYMKDLVLGATYSRPEEVYYLLVSFVEIFVTLNAALVAVCIA